MTARLEANGNLAGAAWCFSTMGCPELSLTEAAQLAAEFRIPAMELRSLSNTIKLPELFAETGLGPARVTDLCRQNSVRLAVAGSSFKLMSTSDTERDELLRFAGWADDLGIPYVRVFSGGTWGEPLTDAQVQLAARNVEWWRAQQAVHGWQIEMLLETHDAFSASGPCLRLNALLAKPQLLIWDSHHTWRYGGETPAATWQQLGPFIRHVHVKDSIAKPSARHPFTYVLPGSGETPLAAILEVLHAGKFTGQVSLEWEKLWHPYLPPLSEALAALRQQPWFALARTTSSRPSARQASGATA